MYNRYLSQEPRQFSRLPFEEEKTQTAQDCPQNAPPEKKDSEGTLKDFFAHLRTRLPELEKSDLALLALIYFLYQEKADDELLIALALLLIL